MPLPDGRDGDDGSAAPLGHDRLCQVEDFSHPDVVAVLHEVFPHEVARFGPDFPRGVEYRKHWEIAMAVLALREGGALRPDADILGIGAGNEPTIFWLTTQVHRVFATDLYIGQADWQESANASMLTDPGVHWPGAWNPRRLVVQHMNALDLRYEDASFDGIFSSSSLEHFGEHRDVRRSLEEMCRVLKPGGICTVSTEFRIAGDGNGLPGILMFTADQLQRAIGDLPWDLMDPLYTSLSEATLATAYPFAEAAADVISHVRTHGHLVFHRLNWRHYPHIVLTEGEYIWTSVHFALRRR